MKKSHSSQARLQDKTIGSYLDALSSNSATPGGGAVTALTGAQAAALIAMVCEFTKVSDAFPAKTISLMLNTANAARRTFLQLAQKDIVVFDALMEILKKPTNNSEQPTGRTIKPHTTKADTTKSHPANAQTVKARTIARKTEIQSALIQAAEVPRQVMNLAVELAADIETLKLHGNKNLITDLGMASILLQTTASSAQLNILINVKGVKDKPYKAKLLEEIAACQSTMTALKAIDKSIYDSLSG